jgi:hypothetical protein
MPFVINKTVHPVLYVQSLLGSRYLHFCHTDFLTLFESVSTKTVFRFITHSNCNGSFVKVTIHICMVLGYYLFYDLLEMWNCNK